MPKTYDPDDISQCGRCGALGVITSVCPCGRPTTRRVTVAAVKKTRHGGYGRRLATVVLDVVVDAEGFANERDIHHRALALLRQQLPTLNIATEIIDWSW